MKNPSQTPVKLLQQPLDEFFFRVDVPANLSRTLNKLVFEGLRQGLVLLADELENVHALSDFLLACQQASGATVLVAEA